MNPTYHDTVFQFIPAGKPADFWVITAYNPKGRTADPGDNIQADARLHSEIIELGVTPFRVIGLSPDESHAEPGWGVPCDEETAIKIARRFRQDSVYHFTTRSINLVNCRTSKRQPLDHPDTRIRGPRDLRHFTLFVGSPPDRNRLDPLNYAGVCTRVGALFPGFTIQRAGGYYAHRFEDTLLIHVATREPRKVLEVAHALRCFLNQDGIGVSHNGIYQRVRDWSDDTMLLESFDL
jgi:hypothetical protein